MPPSGLLLLLLLLGGADGALRRLNEVEDPIAADLAKGPIYLSIAKDAIRDAALARFDAQQKAQDLKLASAAASQADGDLSDAQDAANDAQGDLDGAEDAVDSARSDLIGYEKTALSLDSQTAMKQANADEKEAEYEYLQDSEGQIHERLVRKANLVNQLGGSFQIAQGKLGDAQDDLGDALSGQEKAAYKVTAACQQVSDANQEATSATVSLQSSSQGTADSLTSQAAAKAQQGDSAKKAAFQSSHDVANDKNMQSTQTVVVSDSKAIVPAATSAQGLALQSLSAWSSYVPTSSSDAATASNAIASAKSVLGNIAQLNTLAGSVTQPLQF